MAPNRGFNLRLRDFLNRDPIDYKGGPNLYAFCDGNPVNRTDPSGLQAGGTTIYARPWPRTADWFKLRSYVWEDAAGNRATYVDIDDFLLTRNSRWVMAHRPGYEFYKAQAFAEKYKLNQTEWEELQYDSDYYEPLNFKANASRKYDAPANVNKYEEDPHALSLAWNAEQDQRAQGVIPESPLTEEQIDLAKMYETNKTMFKNLDEIKATIKNGNGKVEEIEIGEAAADR